MATTPSDDRIKDLLLDAIELDEAARAAFLDAACNGDPALRARLDALLGAHSRAGEFMADPTADQHPGTPLAGAAAPQPEIGEAIGPYTLERLIGEGGFGVVYLARQDQPIARKIALKILKPGMDTNHVIARFEAERQALAMMDHPGIAKVIDAGATPAGRPYFAMEYVDGKPVTEYCDDNRLSIRRRLEIFERICLAVQHAHQKGIIHRDIKPSNILVARIDQTPVPKVIDFGIAKAVAGPTQGATRITLDRQLIGTPEYMSPEQAAASSDQIDTRSDVYSLGVLLYELVCGMPPFDRKRLRAASPVQLERALREEQPPKPSARYAAVDDDRDRIASLRTADPAQLQRALRGDLDWIVMRAIEKDPERRYLTANALGADVRRHLDDEPVEAGPPSRVYLAGKFLKRHRVATSAAGVTTFAILAGLVLATVGLARADQQSKRADRALQEARTQLWESYLAQARATRLGTRPGRRFQSLDAVAGAARIEPTIDLRNEAIASLMLADVRIDRVWPGVRSPSARGLDTIDRYVRLEGPGDLRVVDADDDHEICALEGPDVPAYTTLFSRSGRYLAARFGEQHDEAYIVYDLSTREPLVSLGREEFLANAAAFGRDGDAEWVAVGRRPNAVDIYDLPSGTRRVTLDVEPGWTFLAASADGRSLAATNLFGQTLTLYDARTGATVATTDTPARTWSLDFSADGRFLAGGGDDFNVYVWNVDDLSIHAVMPGHQGQVVGVDFATNGSILASTAWDNTIRIWDADRAETVVGPIENWGLVGFGDKLAGASTERLAIWHYEPGRESVAARSMLSFGTFASIAIDPRADLLATAGDNGVALWDARTGLELLAPTAAEALGVEFVDDGRRLIAIQRDGLHSWDLHRDPTGIRLGDHRLVWSESGEQRLSLVGDGSLAAVSSRSGVTILDHADGTVVATLPPYRGLTLKPSATPDLRYVFSGNWKGPVGKVRDLETGETVLEHAAENVVGAFSPDGRLLVVGDGRRFDCYDVPSWNLRWTYARDNTDSHAGAVAFSDDARLLALGRSRFAVDLVQPATGRVLATIESPEHEALAHVAFSSDAGWLAMISTGTAAELIDLAEIRRRLREIELDWSDTFP